MLKVIGLSLIGMLMLSGCATPRYNQSHVGSYTYFQRGVVESVERIEIGDNGVGTVVGAVVGGLVGNQVGKGRGKTVATVVGAGAGAYAGNQINSDIGQELYIRLDNGNELKHITKGERFRMGDYVELEFQSNQIVNVSLARR